MVCSLILKDQASGQSHDTICCSCILVSARDSQRPYQRVCVYVCHIVLSSSPAIVPGHSTTSIRGGGGGGGEAGRYHESLPLPVFIGCMYLRLWYYCGRMRDSTSKG